MGRASGGGGAVEGRGGGGGGAGRWGRGGWGRGEAAAPRRLSTQAVAMHCTLPEEGTVKKPESDV